MVLFIFTGLLLIYAILNRTLNSLRKCNQDEKNFLLYIVGGDGLFMSEFEMVYLVKI